MLFCSSPPSTTALGHYAGASGGTGRRRGTTPQSGLSWRTWFPLGVFGLITMFAVANSALINMLMASRLVYGMSREGVLPSILGRVHRNRRTPYVAIAFTTLLAFGLITFVGAVPALGGTTALLLLGVFTVVNVAVLVLRKDEVAHEHFRTPTFLAVLGAVSCAFLVEPWTGRDVAQYTIAGVLLAIGAVLWGLTSFVMRPYANSMVQTFHRHAIQAR